MESSLESQHGKEGTRNSGNGKATDLFMLKRSMVLRPLMSKISLFASLERHLLVRMKAQKEMLLQVALSIKDHCFLVSIFV